MAAATAPTALYIAAERSRLRDIAVCGLQMWAYMTAYEMPNDDPQALRRRAHVDYPVKIDRVLGLGKIPSQRLQAAFTHDHRISKFERLLVWSHWVWFAVPHLSVAYTLARRPKKFPSAAARMYAVFDTGAVIYWLAPTAPPWWAAASGHVERLPHGVEVDEAGHRSDHSMAHLPVRRMMLEYGETFWGSRWNALYDTLGGNPLAAMPSLHFATSVMAARLLSEVDPVAGTVGWLYAGTLGLALVYLGEHYAIDLIGGAALAEAVHFSSKPVTPAARNLKRALDSLHKLGEAD
ncbi:MAG: phosphatase PAP2 family protein [Solirubrobacteraceae bacterium]